MRLKALRSEWAVLPLVLAVWLGWSGAARAEQVHVVKPSETLSEVARKYGVSTAALANRNHIKNVNILRSGQRLIIPAGQASEVRYTVKRGDSVAAIASKYGIGAATLIRQNNLTDPGRIVPGQTLVIPGGASASRKWDLPPGLQATLERIHPSKRWRYIVIHHSASKDATPLSMDRHHRSRGMENGLAYHFVIGNGRHTGDGAIHVGHRWAEQLDGGHLSSLSQNRNCIGICLIGDFNLSSPSRKQMAALRELIGYLMDRCDLDKNQVVTHQEINTRPTECPGKRFPKRRVLAGL